MFGCVPPMASDNDSSASSRVLPSLLSYGKQLSPEWKAAATTDQRIYFVNQRTRSTHWFPPPEFWTSKLGLPYGWEAALDDQNKKYYINHVTRTTTREDPRSEADQATHLPMTPTQARRIELVRDASIGFGFVAGSEKPVVIRSVIPNGPSHDKLFANDQILKVNGKNVRDLPQADVINLIKSAVSRIELEVVASEDVQDSKNQHNRKSSLMSRTTRERRRSTPVSVRFADEPALVQVIGPMEPVRRSSVPLLPNVLKVFLENGQTRSFRYDSNTTAEEIFSSFASKLDLRLMEYFSLVLTGPKKGQISYIQNHEKVSEIYTNRNCSSVNCLCKLNIAFVPKDHIEVLSQDPNAFEYLYAQVTNRVVEGFYGMDIKYDLAIKLAALQIQQKAIEAAAGRPLKISVRQMEKEFGGLNKFVSSDVLHSVKEKELRKILDQQVKQNENLASPGERHMSSLQCKIHYLNLAVEIFSYGGRYFDVVLVDNGSDGPSLKKSKKQHVTVLVNLKYGVSQVVRGKVNVLCQLADFHEITGFKVSVCEENKQLLRIRLQEGKVIQFICTSLDCTDMIALITGYYKVYVDNTSNTPLPVENEDEWPFSFRRHPPVNDAPEFYSKHRVVPDVWAYPSRFQTLNAKNKTQAENTAPLNGQTDVFIDLSRAPPRFHETAISEESGEEHVVAGKVIWMTLDQDSVNNKPVGLLNPQDEDKADGANIQRNDTPELVMTQDSQDLLEKVSCTENINSVSGETQSDFSIGGVTDGDSEELSETRKRRRASSGTSGKDALAVKSARTAATDDCHADEDDLISELVLAEEIWNNEEAGGTVFDESEGEVSVNDTESLSSMSTDCSNSWVVVPVNSEELNMRVDNAVDERKGIASVLGSPGHVTAENGSSQPEQVEKEIETTGLVKNEMFVRRERSATDALGSSSNRGTTISAKDSGPTLAFSDQKDNQHLILEQVPFISTDPFPGRRPTPSPSDLGFDKRKFDNKGIELVEDETASEGSDLQESASHTLEKRVHQGSKNSDANRTQLEEVQLKDYSRSGNDTINISHDLNDHKDSEESHIDSSVFVESSDTETASEMSDEEESLFSTFPEYFQPNRRLKYSGSKQAVLLLAEEDQDDAEAFNSSQKDLNFAPVSLKEFQVKNDLNTLTLLKYSEDANPENDCEELSTPSSESTEFTYEVNPELMSEDGEGNWNSDPLYLKEEQEESKQGIDEQQHDTNGDHLPVSLVSLHACFNDRHDISLDAHSSLNAKELEVEESTQSLTTDRTVSSSPYDSTNFKEKESIVETSKSVSNEGPSMLPESNCRNYGSNGSSPSFDPSLKHILGFRSLSDSIEKSKAASKELDRSYSPSDWIIPLPPTPTPELQENDIQIVPPPPADVVTSEDELDKELKGLIVPPPPSLAETVQTILNIRIASPPPPPPAMDVSSNEVDDLLDDYNEIRFLSLTDDHKLAHNKGLVPKKSLSSNFTEDKKIQAQRVEADGLSVSDRNEHFLNRCKTNISTKQCSTCPVPRECSVYLHHSPSGLSTLQESSISRQGISDMKRMDVLDDFPNFEVVNSRDLDNINYISMKSDEANKVAPSICSTSQENISMKSRSMVTLKQKPPVPPKPRFPQETKSESRAKKCDSSPDKFMGVAPNEEHVIKVEGNDQLTRTVNEHKEGLKSLPAKANVSFLGSETQNESFFNDSNNNLRSSLDALSQVQTPHKTLEEAKDLETCDSVNSSDLKVGFSLNAVMELGYEKTAKRATPFHSKAVFSPSATAEDALHRNETNKQRDSRVIGRNSSFTPKSPYVPSPYSPSQTSYSSQSSVTDGWESSLNFDRISPVESRVADSKSPQCTFSPFLHPKPSLTTPYVPAASQFFNNAGSPDSDKVFHLQRPLHHDVNGNLVRNSCQDDGYHVLPETPTEHSYLQLATNLSNSNTKHGKCAYPVELHEDIIDNLSPSSTLPPLPDCSPPPLPETSPPKTIPGFDANDLDFGEPLPDTCQDYAQSDLPSSATELKTGRSSRSLTLTSSPRGENCGTLSEDTICHGGAVLSVSETKCSSLCFDNRSKLGDDINSCPQYSLEEDETKCAKVCEEGLSKVSDFKKRLEEFLSRRGTSVKMPDRTKNWPLVLQNNARFLACDVKVISSSLKRGRAQVVSAISASLDSLEKLVESCENVNAVSDENSSYNVRTLVSLVTKVLEHYGDVITTVKAVTVEKPNDSDVELLAEKAIVMSTSIASLIRNIRNTMKC